jgi:hypothetical protein
VSSVDGVAQTPGGLFAFARGKQAGASDLNHRETLHLITKYQTEGMNESIP